MTSLKQTEWAVFSPEMHILCMSQKSDPQLNFRSKSKSQMNFYICDGSMSLISAQTHCMVPCHTACNKDSVILPCSNADGASLLGVSNSCFVRLTHSPQTPDKSEVFSISLLTCSTLLAKLWYLQANKKEKFEAIFRDLRKT